jgi:hypothetical protein
MRKVSGNGRLIHGAVNANRVRGYVLKADIYHYFENVSHEALIKIISKKNADQDLLWLIWVILQNYDSDIQGKGMPLGNWTSQFFANVYLNELDQFVKHQLKAKYYLRYVDDFIIFHQSKETLEKYESEINIFLQNLSLKLHPDKSKIVPLRCGVSFLGYRIFYHFKLVKKRNLHKIINKIQFLLELYKLQLIDANDIFEVLSGWKAYAMQANTFHLRQRLSSQTEKLLNM